MKLITYLSENEEPDNAIGYKPKSIALEDALSIIKKECSEILRAYKKHKKFVIARCISENYNAAFVDSTNITRRSRFAGSNFYTLLIDNLPSWKKYPKRSKGVICLTDYPYRSGSCYIVFPYDGTNIGVCPAHDIWYSFKYYIDRGYSLGDFNDVFNDFFKHLSDIGLPLPRNADKDWNTLKQALEDVEKYKNESVLNDELKKHGYNKNNEDDYKIGDFVSLILREIGSQSIIDYLNDIMSPNKNGFKLKETGDPLDFDKEVWFTGKCVMINTMSQGIIDSKKIILEMID